MERKKLIFIGGGDLQREILWTVHSISFQDREWQPFGIIDDNPDEIRKRLTNSGTALKMIGSISDHQPSSDEVFIPAIGSPRLKLHVAELIESRGGVFVNVIHPTAIIAPDASLGKGIFAFMNSVVSVGAIIEDYVTLNVGALVGHDATIGRGSTLSPVAAVTGHARLGKGVFMGTHAGIIPGKAVHDWCVIAAGSIAMQEVPTDSTVVGVPARLCAPSKMRSS